MAAGLTVATDPPVSVRNEDGVLRLQLDRPAARNALTPEALEILLAAVADAGGESTDVRVVVLEAAGDHFCAGFDLTAADRSTTGPPRTGHVQRGMRRGAHRLVQEMWDLQVPIVGVVRGWATGLGCNLALACDYVVASSSARFAEPFVGRGFVPDTGAAYFLPRLIGVSRAKEMLLFGRVVTGEEAAAWGMVAQAVPDDELEAAATAAIARIASSATLAVGFAKELVHRSLARDLSGSLAEEGFIQELSLRTADFKEGMTAFVEKRPPEFRGR